MASHPDYIGMHTKQHPQGEDEESGGNFSWVTSPLLIPMCFIRHTHTVACTAERGAEASRVH